MTDQLDRLKAALADRYAIEREIGSGGMATVYLAEDLKHHRQVAVKVLLPELAAVLGSERFLREIEIAANLQHPHILPLYDSGSAGVPDGPREFLYYVMPYVDGESLRDRLEREQQLPVEDAVRIAQEVADGLSYAHSLGVIHRDIKPENILLSGGHALVADFGIARAVTAAGGSRLTETGLSLGTPQYMSPEQASGEREVDGRSDVYALGCVAYEMLTGEPPHAGPNPQAIIAKVLTQPAPSVRASRETVPTHVDCAIRKALARLPADRFATAHEYAAALDSPVGIPPADAAALDSGRDRPKRTAPAVRWMPWLVAAASLILAGTLALDRPSPARTLHLNVVLSNLAESPDPLTFAISPDGTQIAYVGLEDRLYLRRLDDTEARPLNGTEGAVGPSFSHDGRHVAYFDGDVRRIAVDGGLPLTVASPGPSSIHVRESSVDWGDDGFIYFSHPSGTLARVPADGGTIERLTVLDSTTEGAHLRPYALPGGRGVLFSIWRWPSSRDDIAVLDLETRVVRVLARGTHVQYTSSGHVMFTNPEQAVLVAPFDQRTLVMTGVPRPAFVATNQGSSFTVSKDGTLLYQARPAAPGLVLVDRTGSERQLRDDPVQAMYPRVSPDGRRIAMGAEGSDGMNIWVLDMADSVLSRLTFGGDDIYPSWSADGHDILFSRSAAGSTAETEWTFYRIPADGGGEPRPMFQEPQSQVEILETPDGRWFVYRAGDVARGEDPDLYCTPTDGGEHRRIVVSPFNDRSPALSPDGRWLAYVSDESGVDDVYVQRFPGPAGRRQVSDGGGTSPVWSRSGAELFYITGGYLVAAEVETTTEFAVRNRQRLFPTSPYVQSGSHAAYDVLAGDSAFVFVDRGYHRTRLEIVLNWFEELPR